MKQLRYTLILLLFSLSLYAQQEDIEKRESFIQAESEYQIGRIDNAIHTLNQNVASYSGTIKVSAYRLLALCHLAQDNLEEANKCIDLLLKEDPYYSISMNDPERFAEIIRKKKEGKTTIITASQQTETLDEAPVPVTLITEEMIKTCGAKNLREVLIAYVPGMSIVENNNEMNIALRGVYTSGQQKILIMLDGHRLNSYSTNSAAPDYSISLEKIQQIEILRGPASSLYGNVALTGVINIITKRGIDIDGLKAKVGIGNYNQYKADILFGKRFMDTDFMGWASFYQAQGEKVFESKTEGYGLLPLDGNVIIQGFNAKPTLDLGFNFNWKNFRIFYNYQQSKMVAPYSTSVFCAPYTYDKYRQFDGIKPGHSRVSNRGEISYENTWGKWGFKASAYLDAEENNNYDVAGDSIYPISIPIPAIKDTLYPTNGCFQALNWQDYLYGFSSQLNYNYNIQKHKGSILAGIQLESYNLYDSYMIVGDKYEDVLSTYSKKDEQIKSGNELSISSFIQIKQKLHNYFIINAGLRHDYKRRLNNKNIHALSPRISFIFLKDRWNMKLNYSRAFVDAPYFHRNNILAIYKGADNLSPEYMESIQYSFSYKFSPINLSYEGNFYFNNLTDLIYNTPSSEIQYINAGHLRTLGIEHTIHYKYKKFNANFNFTWQHLLNTENYPTAQNRINNIPSLTSNIILSQRLLSSQKQSLSVHLHGNITSKQIAQTTSYANGIPAYREEEIPAKILINLGIDYNWKNLGFSINTYNLSNYSYKQGGSSINLIQQPGLWVLSTISYIFK